VDTLQLFLNGFSAAMSFENLTYAFLGSLLGTVIGVLPGIGPAAGSAILLPLTFQLSPTGAIIMLAAIYYGAQYGGTITSVLLNVPGEASTVITCFDGHPMAKQGRAGAALSIAAIGSFIGAIAAISGMIIAAPPLANLALKFGPPEMFGLLLMGMSLIIGLSGKSWTKGMLMGLLGLFIGLVGMDPSAGVPRFTFGNQSLLGGLEIIPIVMGLFGVADVLESAEKSMAPVLEEKLSSLIPSRQDIRDSIAPIARGSVLGFVMGLIPGMQPSITTFASYVLEKRLSKHPERFGAGAIEGVAAPETANNAFVQSAMIPLFSLGIPTTATMGVIMGALMMNGLTPGPLLFKEHPDFVWAVIASFVVGNFMLVILNLPLIGIWVRVLKIPHSILLSAILMFTFVGAYTINNSAFDVGVLAVFGVIGYVLKKLDFPTAPMILTAILGPMIEGALLGTMQMSQGDITIIFNRPISAIFTVIALLLLASPLLRYLSFGRVVERIRERAEVE
jgi:putative tricarboxylic transport membrane protein